MKTEITIGFDTESFDGYTDDYLACLWAVAQVNPAPVDELDPGRIAELIGREIIRRWLERVGLPLWNHQGSTAYCLAAGRAGKWKKGVYIPNHEAQPCSSP